MKKLTDRQKEVIAFIKSYIEENGCPPTIRECSVHFNISVRAVQCHYLALQKKGYLSNPLNKSRSIRLLKDTEEPEHKLSITKIPVLGLVNSTKQLLNPENIEDYIDIKETLTDIDSSCFALKIKDDSMKNEGILSGDIAIIHQTNDVQNEQIVVAILEEKDSLVLRKFYQESCRIRLQSENPDYKTIYCQAANIVGVLKKIIRTY